MNNKRFGSRLVIPRIKFGGYLFWIKRMIAINESLKRVKIEWLIVKKAIVKIVESELNCSR